MSEDRTPGTKMTTTAVGPAIRLAIHDGQLLANPIGYLGSEFAAYRAACSASGLRWNGKANAGAPAALAALVANLAAAGFSSVIEGSEAAEAAIEAKRVAFNAAAAATADEDAARARLAKIEAKLAESGKALYGFQKEGVVWLSSTQSGILGSEMGTGKTIQFLVAIPENGRGVVIVPASLRLNWKAECAIWRPDLKVTVLLGRSCFRWPEAGELVVLAYEGLADTFGPAPEGVFLAADECQFAKSKTAVRTKRLMTLAAAARGAKGRTFGLSGTPLKNRPPELWTVLEVFGVAEKAFGHFGRFYWMFGAYKTKYATEWGCPRPEAAEALRKVMLRHERKDVLDLPEKQHQVLLVEPSREVSRLAGEVLAKLAAAGVKWDEENEVREVKPGRNPND